MATAASGAAPVWNPQYSGFFRRLAAWLIDAPVRFCIGLALVYLPMRLLVSVQVQSHGSGDPTFLWRVMSVQDKSVVMVLWLFAAVFIPWWYTALQESSTPRATLGKRLLGIQVTDLDGRCISFGRASARFFVRIIVPFGIGYCLVLFTRRKQALHDLVAGCVVVRVTE